MTAIMLITVMIMMAFSSYLLTTSTRGAVLLLSVSTGTVVTAATATLM